MESGSGTGISGKAHTAVKSHGSSSETGISGKAHTAHKAEAHRHRYPDQFGRRPIVLWQVKGKAVEGQWKGEMERSMDGKMERWKDGKDGKMERMERMERWKGWKDENVNGNVSGSARG